MRYHSPVTTRRPLIPPVGFLCCVHYVQALQMGNQLCWFSRKGMRAFPMSYWMYFFMMCLSQPLSPCSVDYTSPSTTSLTNWSTTSLPDYRSSSPSLVIPSLKLSSPHWPPIWWSCFCIPLLGGSCFFLAVVDPKIGSYNNKKQTPVTDASCMMLAGDLQYLSTPPQALSFPSLLVFKGKNLWGHTQLVPLLCRTKLLVPHLPPRHLVYCVSADLQMEQELSSSC